MINQWATPGARCVCIDAEFTARCSYLEYVIPTRLPMLGEVLTVRAARHDDYGVWLTFWEIDTRQVDGPLAGDCHWSVKNFKPLESRSTDISVFERIVRTAKLPELV